MAVDGDRRGSRVRTLRGSEQLRYPPRAARALRGRAARPRLAGAGVVLHLTQAGQLGLESLHHSHLVRRDSQMPDLLLYLIFQPQQLDVDRRMRRKGRRIGGHSGCRHLRDSGLTAEAEAKADLGMVARIMLVVLLLLLLVLLVLLLLSLLLVLLRLLVVLPRPPLSILHPMNDILKDLARSDSEADP